MRTLLAFVSGLIGLGLWFEGWEEILGSLGIGEELTQILLTALLTGVLIWLVVGLQGRPPIWQWVMWRRLMKQAHTRSRKFR